MTYKYVSNIYKYLPKLFVPHSLSKHSQLNKALSMAQLVTLVIPWS